jgi:hypothetical protein
VLILEMGAHVFPAIHRLVPMSISVWIQFVLATPVVLWAGWPFFERGWASLKTRNFNMFTLIAMGTGVAWIYSVIATLAPSAVPAGLPRRGRHGCRLFRGGRGDHRPRAARPDARTARAGTHLGRDQGAAQPCTKDRAPDRF